MVGSSKARRRSTAHRPGASEGRVLITGENGLGKELISPAIHQHSKRKRRRS